MASMNSAYSVADLQELRDRVGALGNMALSEDMVERIIKDQTGSEIDSKIVQAVKKIIDIVGVVSDPSSVYTALVQSNLELAAVEKIQKIVAIKQKYALEENQFLKGKEKERQLLGLNNQLRALNKDLERVKNEEDNKDRTVRGTLKEINEKIEAYNKAIEAHPVTLLLLERAPGLIEKNQAELGRAQGFLNSSGRKDPGSVQRAQKAIGECSQQIAHLSAKVPVWKAQLKIVEELEQSIEVLKKYLAEAKQSRECFAKERCELESRVNQVQDEIEKLKAKYN